MTTIRRNFWSKPNFSGFAETAPTDSPTAAAASRSLLLLLSNSYTAFPISQRAGLYLNFVMASPTDICAENTNEKHQCYGEIGNRRSSSGSRMELQLRTQHINSRILECSNCPPDQICSDGFSTPKSAQHRISHCSECPPPPRKRRVKPHWRAVPFKGILIPHDYMEAINLPPLKCNVAS
eukprot:Gb_04325 [translate_table: standard]